MPDIFRATEKPKNPEEVLKAAGKSLNIHTLEGHSHSPFAAFNYFPDSIKFVAKDPSEKIVLLLRRHLITNINWILLTILLLFAPVILSAFPILNFLPGRYQFIAVTIWYLIIVAYALESFLDWFFNVCIITNETVFDVDFTNLIYREISEADLDHIQDVTVRMGGVIRTMFNYGDVFIQTAGEVPRIEFEAIPYPDKVAKILRELCFQEERKRRSSDI